MEEGVRCLPGGAVTLRRERPLRMAITAAANQDAPLIEARPFWPSAVPVYSALASYDWRRDEPLSSPRDIEGKAA